MSMAAVQQTREAHSLPSIIQDGVEITETMAKLAARVELIANALGVHRPAQDGPTPPKPQIEAVPVGLHAILANQRVTRRLALQISDDLLAIENTVS